MYRLRDSRRVACGLRTLGGMLCVIGLMACSKQATTVKNTGGEDDKTNVADTKSKVAAIKTNATAADPSPKDRCGLDPKWLTNSNPQLPTEEFPSTGVDNCSFHQWAWESFLALMFDAGGGDGKVFQQLADPASLFPDTGKGPTMDYPGRTSGQGPVFLINQAGPGDNVLFDQQKQLIYYSVYLNKTYWDTVTKERYYDLATLQGLNSKSTPFPPGTLELKVSWRVASEGSEVYIKDTENYYVIDAVVPKYAVKNKHVVAVPGTRTVKLAMVGFHIAGVVKGHPEFIWATFEQLQNAPNIAPSSTPSAPATKGPFGAKGVAWSLYKPGTPSDQTNMYDTGAPTAPANITRLDPWGGGSALNTSNIIELNKNVWSQLPATRKLLKQYFEVGAIWTTGAVPVNDAGFTGGLDAAKILKGSFHADNPQAGVANTTMETFTQFQNCFYCHNAGEHTVAVLQPDGRQLTSVVGAKALNLSHFIVNYQANQQLSKGAK